MAVIRLGNLLWRPHTRPISPEDPVDVKDVNTADIKAKLEQVRQLLSGVATENKLEQARALLEAISTKDFATQTTLAAVLAKLGQLETEIQAVKANQLSGDQKVQLSGTNVEVVKIMDALAITNTSIAASNLVDVSKYSRGKLIVYSTLRVDFDFWVQLGATVNTFVFGDDSWDDLSNSPIVIPSQAHVRFLINSHPRYREIFNSGIPSLRCVVRCRTAPTEGAVTVKY